MDDAAKAALSQFSASSAEPQQETEPEASPLADALRTLDRTPADEGALATIEPLLLDAEAYSELSNRYAEAATCAGTDVRARQLLEHAIELLQQLPAAAPAVLGLTERLAQLPALRQSEPALLRVVQAGGADGAKALVKLGERWLAEGRAREGAELLPRDLDHLQGEAALDVLERLFDHAEDATRLEQVLQRRVNLQQTPSARGRALEKLGAFHQDFQQDQPAASGALLASAQAYLEAGEADDAERAYERLLDISPGHANAAAKLLSLRAAAGNFVAVADAFGILLRASDDSRRGGELLLSIVKDAERAGAAEEFAELADTVLWRLSGEDRELGERLLRASAALFAAQTRHDEAAELYRRLIADRATSEDLDAYQTLIDSHPGSEWRRNQQRWLFEWQEHHSSDRPTILLSWARFEEQDLGDPQAAMNVLGRAAELSPDRPEIWANLARLRLTDGDGAGALVAASELRRLGRDVDSALLGLLLEHEPNARWAIDRVKLTLSAEQRWPELFEMYDRAIAASADGKEQATWLDEAAIAARDVAQDRARAISYWERYIELEPDEARVDFALERLFEQASAKPALVRHLQRRLARVTTAERPALEQRIANLSLEVGALDDALAAIERLRATSDEAGDELLERVFARSLELAAQAPEVRKAGQRAAQLLRERYQALEKPAESARLLRAELGLALATEERRALLSELSRLCERGLGDLAGAFDAERELFLLTRAERERKRLRKLGKKLGRYRDLFDVEPERAIAVFEQLEAEGDEKPEAFEALCQLLDQSERVDELSRVLLRRTETHASPALFSRLGRLQADRLGDATAAIASHLAASDARAASEVFLRQTSVFGANPVPALELSRCLCRVGLPEAALRVLRHQLAFYAEQYPPERKLVQLELVKTLEESGAVDAAREELSEAAKRYPTDADVQRACAAAAVARQDWDKAEQCYRTLLLLLHGAGAQTTTLRRASVYVELGAIKLGRGETAAASELFESGFEMALGNAQELTALAQALVAHACWEPAERAIAELLKLAQDLPTAAHALSGVARLLLQSHTPSVGLLAQAAEIAEKSATRCAELTDTAERSNLLSACVSLLPLAEAKTLLLTHEAELTAEDAGNARLGLARRLLDDGSEASRASAIAELEASVRHPEAPPAAWALLARAWDGTDQDKLAQTLDAWLEREPNNPSVLDRALRLALARAAAERALELYDRLTHQGRAPAAELATDLYRLCLTAGKTERAVQLLRTEAEREQKAPKRAALLVEAAELMLSAGDASAASDTAAEAQRLDPSSADAVLLQAKLELSRGQGAEALARLTAHAESKERRRGKPLSRVLRLAADLRLAQDELGEALPLLAEAHQLDKSDVDTALLLGLLAIDLDRLETAASAFRVLIAQRELGTREGAAGRSPALAQGYFQLARIERHHGKKTNARRMALRALEENPHLIQAQQLLSELGAN